MTTTVTPIYSVTELTHAIKNILEPRFSAVQVKGEITNLKVQSSGHIYFTLKDNSSQISAVLFRGNAAQSSYIPKAGDEVVVHGQLSIYPPRGNYQLIVRTIEQAGVGELLLQLHALKMKLEKAGWLDPAIKKPLPKYPKTIGVVTSPTGSVIQDIINVLKRRFHGFHLILNPVKVQGAGAAEEIATAIRDFNALRLVDVMIVGRGGGSIEDLWPFNEECVANAIHESEIPIISAVGHETDYSIADYVADVRAPTPSAAAEIAQREKKVELDYISGMEKRITQAVVQKVREDKLHLQGLVRHPLFTSPYYLLSPYLQKIDELSTKLQGFNPAQKVANLREKLGQYELALKHRIAHLISEKKERFIRLISHLQSIDPKNLLKKGYCIPFAEKSNSVIISSSQLEIGQKISVLFHDGKALTTVDSIEHD